MIRKVCCFVSIAILLPLLTAHTTAETPSVDALKLHERYTLSLELDFRKKNQNTLERAIALLDSSPNGHATGFLVGDGLLMTAYHVVSGELSNSKKALLGFKPKDELRVKVYVNGCEATVVSVDRDADLALLNVCRTPKHARTPAFQTQPSRDERVFLIARPDGDKMVSRGSFYGSYNFRGHQYWSARLTGRDGYSGSPVYNEQAELVGVFSGYDRSRKLAVISPSLRAQKLLEDYLRESQP